MNVVSSVWIEDLRGLQSPIVDQLRTLAAEEELLVGDLILTEVLQGARDELHASRIESALRSFPVVPLLGPALAPIAARNYRHLRSLGVTVRKTADIIIGTWCVEHGRSLLQDERDFEPMATHVDIQLNQEQNC